MTENPYSAPHSNLVSVELLNRNITWKIYFFFMVLLTTLGISGLFLIPGSGISEIISLVLTIPAILGLYGYVFSKKILTRKIWLVNFYVQLIWAPLYYFVTNADLSAGMTQEVYLINNTVMWAISIPSYIALFLYARKNYPLWHEQA
ncbi:hypothetical protein [Pseudomonas sp. EA_35y_Pfl2_R5]|uniref:hypothetical protein n=1 Tax=Pseudomonas sp. EA_35y_Pfl2_R5 TaxID=3088690 RepID=UPI0030D9BDA5